MRTNRSVSSVVMVASFAVAMLAGCSQAPGPPTGYAENGWAAITAAEVSRWRRPPKRKNLDKCMSFYVDDPVLFVPGAPAVIGKDAVRQAFAGFLGVQALKLEGICAGDYRCGAIRAIWRMSAGVIQTRLPMRKGRPRRRPGSWRLVWKKTGGWVLEDRGRYECERSVGNLRDRSLAR